MHGNCQMGKTNYTPFNDLLDFFIRISVAWPLTPLNYLHCRLITAVVVFIGLGFGPLLSEQVFHSTLQHRDSPSEAVVRVTSLYFIPAVRHGEGLS